MVKLQVGIQELSYLSIQSLSLPIYPSINPTFPLWPARDGDSVCDVTTQLTSPTLFPVSPVTLSSLFPLAPASPPLLSSFSFAPAPSLSLEYNCSERPNMMKGSEQSGRSNLSSSPREFRLEKPFWKVYFYDITNFTKTNNIKIFKITILSTGINIGQRVFSYCQCKVGQLCREIREQQIIEC